MRKHKRSLITHEDADRIARWRRLMLGFGVTGVAALATKAAADTAFTSFQFPGTNRPSSRTMPDRISDVYNVKDYGARGDNTGTSFANDDTAAIQACVAAAKAGPNATIFFPAGFYKVSKTIDFTAMTGRIVGAGRDLTQIIGYVPTAGADLDQGFVFLVSAQPNGNSGPTYLAHMSVTNTSSVIGTGAVSWHPSNGQVSYVDMGFSGMIGLQCAFNDFNHTIYNCVFSAAGNAYKFGTFGIISNGFNMIGCRGEAWDTFAELSGSNGSFVAGCGSENNGIGFCLGFTHGLATQCTIAQVGGQGVLTIGGVTIPGSGGVTNGMFHSGDFLFGNGVTNNTNNIWGNPYCLVKVGTQISTLLTSGVTTASSSLTGNILTVVGMASGTIQNGKLVWDKTDGSGNITVGSTISGQITSSTVSGITTATSTIGGTGNTTLTISGIASGSIQNGMLVWENSSGTGILPGTTISGGPGGGGAGTYTLSQAGTPGSGLTVNASSVIGAGGTYALSAGGTTSSGLTVSVGPTNAANTPGNTLNDTGTYQLTGAAGITVSSPVPMISRRNFGLGGCSIDGIETEGCMTSMWADNIGGCRISSCLFTGTSNEVTNPSDPLGHGLPNANFLGCFAAAYGLYVNGAKYATFENITSSLTSGWGAIYFNPNGRDKYGISVRNCTGQQFLPITITATASGTTLTVTSTSSPSGIGIGGGTATDNWGNGAPKIQGGMLVSGGTIAAGTRILYQTSGPVGGTGTYLLDTSQAGTPTATTVTPGPGWVMPADSLMSGVQFESCDSPYYELPFNLLPGQPGTANTPIAGMEYNISDATTCSDSNACATWGATVTAGGAGAHHVRVRYNGTNWTIIAK